MSVIEVAQELGKAITESQELADMRSTQEAMMSDVAAAALVDEFNQKQQRFIELTHNGVQLTSEQKAEIADIEKRMMENPKVLAYYHAQQNFEKMLDGINQIIYKAISGNNGCEGDGSCSSGCCSSCGGGCH